MNAVIFDLDGTLIDSAEDIGLALKRTLDELGLTYLMPKDVSRLIGGGVRALLERVLGERFREEHVKIFRKYYFDMPVYNTKPYPGVPETLEKLKDLGIPMIVVTNKMEDLSREILKILGLDRYFELIVGGDTFGEKKPSPLPVRKALENLGLEPASALMVGDTDSDIIAGRLAGTKTAVALWGYVHSTTERADFELESPLEIVSLAEQVSGV